ncbi:MAG: hypothetical protein M3198_06250 [Actinomycetota bacterium]|nr:hypothetical protein [Actinomycetota bacterium]
MERNHFPPRPTASFEALVPLPPVICLLLALPLLVLMPEDSRVRGRALLLAQSLSLLFRAYWFRHS